MTFFEAKPSHLKKANNFQRAAWSLVKGRRDLGQKQIYLVAAQNTLTLKTNARVIGAMDEADRAELADRLHRIDSGTGVQTEVGILLTSNSQAILAGLVVEFNKLGHTWGAIPKSSPDALSDLNEYDNLSWYLKTVYTFAYPYGL